VTDEGGKRRPTGGRSAPAGRTSVRARAQRAACAQSAGADTPAVGSRRSRRGRPRTPGRRTRSASQRSARCLNATGQRAEGTGGLDATGALDRTYASALERPVARKTAPLARGLVGAAGREAVFPARRAAPGPGGPGAPPSGALGPGSAAARAPTSGAELRRRHRCDSRSSTQPSRHTPPSKPRHQNRLSPHRRPTRHPRPQPTPTSPPPRPQTPPRVASTVHPLGSLTLTSSSLICPAPHSLAAAPPEAPPAPRLGWPVQVYLAGRGRGGPARSGGPPLPPSPGAKRKTGRGQGGGLLRSWTKPIERNRWNETHGGKHARAATRGRRDAGAPQA
jgi:hypothetical protein